MTRLTRFSHATALALLLSAAPVAVLVFAFPGSATAQGAKSAVPVAKARSGVFERTINSIGELKASRSAIVTSTYEGKIVKIIPEGTAVKEGDPIIWMDTDQLTQDLAEREAELLLAQKDLEAAKEEYRLQELQNDYNLKSEEAKVELAEQRLKDAEQKYETEKELVAKNISARSKAEEAELSMTQATVELRSSGINLLKVRENLASNLRVKQSGIERAELSIAAIERRKKELTDKIDTAVLKAPVGGELAYFRIWKNGSSSKVVEGDQVWPRLNILEIPDRSQMVAIVPVNELDVAAVEPGQKATIRLDALPDRLFSGVVERRSIMPLDAQSAGRMMMGSSTSSGPKEFEVRIKLDETEPFFYQGMTVSVRIVTEKLDQAISVPIESITLENDQIGVFRESPSGGEFVPVKVVMVNDRSAAVESSLKENDLVYLRHPKVDATEARTRGFNALRRIQGATRPTPAVADPAVPAAAIPAGPPGRRS